MAVLKELTLAHRGRIFFEHGRYECILFSLSLKLAKKKQNNKTKQKEHCLK